MKKTILAYCQSRLCIVLQSYHANQLAFGFKTSFSQRAKTSVLAV